MIIITKRIAIENKHTNTELYLKLALHTRGVLQGNQKNTNRLYNDLGMILAMSGIPENGIGKVPFINSQLSHLV